MATNDKLCLAITKSGKFVRKYRVIFNVNSPYLLVIVKKWKSSEVTAYNLSGQTLSACLCMSRTVKYMYIQCLRGSSIFVGVFVCHVRVFSFKLSHLCAFAFLAYLYILLCMFKCRLPKMVIASFKQNMGTVDFA